MRIGMVTACYKPVVNGVTRMVALYARAMAARGHEVTIFTLGEPDPAGDEPNVVRSPAFPLGNSGYYFARHYSAEARQRLAAMDMVHCHHLFMSLEMAHRYTTCPIVYTNHTRYDLYTTAYTHLPPGVATAFMHQMWPRFTDYCDVVIAPSASLRDVLQRYGVRQPIEVIPNGVDLSLFEPQATAYDRRAWGVDPSATLAIYVGRLAAEKNVDQLLEQLVIAREIYPDLHLLLVGDGPARPALEAQRAALGLEQAVHFAGAVTYETVPSYLAAADLFVTASTSEVHPLTVIEALAAGLPVVGVHAPGLSDTVESGVTGLLTHTPAGGLAAALVALTGDSTRRRAMGQAARQASRRYAIEETTSLTLALYERLAATGPTRRPDNGPAARPHQAVATWWPRPLV